MALDLKSFSDKLIRYRKQFDLSIDQVSSGTGIDKDRISNLETASVEPTGDEILIIADFYKCDFKYFISNEQLAVFEKTELLFRKYGEKLSVSDRWAIQECIYFAECEKYLDELDGFNSNSQFSYVPNGKFYKQHGIDAAKKLREIITERANELNLDVYSDFRKAGFLIYRRRLENSSISGVCIDYPGVGKIILVNYDEDVFRQRFTIAHEVGHAIFDNEDGNIGFSFSGKWKNSDLEEIRANTFAASFLLPDELIHTIPNNRDWDGSKLIEWSKKAMVNTEPLLISLQNHGLINDAQKRELQRFKVPVDQKTDPEFSGISQAMKARLEQLIEKGITRKYINKCIKAQRDNRISVVRMVEMLQITINELPDINKLFAIGLEHEN